MRYQQDNGYGAGAPHPHAQHPHAQQQPPPPPPPPQAVSSKRMTYGSISNSTREDRERQELFAGADPYNARGGGSFGAAAAPRGAYSSQQQQQHMPQQQQDELSNDELMQQAVEQHKDTTATARRALQVLEQTKEIQGNTQVALADQRQQMHRIEDDLDKMGQDLTYSERILRFMKLCCCFGFCCSCCTEPTRPTNADRKWRGPGGSAPSHYEDGPSYEQHQQHGGKQQRHAGQQQQQQQHNNGSFAYPGVSTQGLEGIGYGQQAAAIDAETQQQNSYLDEISKGLDQLKFGAQRMNEELRYQDSHADRIRNDADTLGYKLSNVNREGFKRI